MYTTTSKHCHLLRHHHHYQQQQPRRHGCRALAVLQTPVSTTTTVTTTTPKLNPIVPKIPPPAENSPKLAAEDPTLRSTWSHRAWVAAGCSSLLVSLAKSIASATESGHLLEPVLAGFLGYILADLGSGVYHWAIDNYGDAATPVFGPQIDAFQGHHRWPWTITKRQFANNLHALAKSVMPAVVLFDVATDDAAVHGFVTACAGCIMFSQQFHAWSHSTKSRLPAAVVALQDAGVLVSRGMHMAHHRPPYNGNYCIVSGVWNPFLDKYRLFEVMEMVVFFRFGVRPRSWTDPDAAWLEDASGGGGAGDES